MFRRITPGALFALPLAPSPGENVGVYGINQGGLGLVSANYNLSYQGNNLTITKALLNVMSFNLSESATPS